MNKLTIVKIGGKVINDKHELNDFLKRFTLIEGKKILVHGGGNIASVWQRKLGVEPKVIEGRRITNQEGIDVVSMVFAGLNKKITAKLQALDIQSLGLCGADLNIIKSDTRSKSPIDYGFVGDVKEVNVEMLSALLDLNIMPVICALTHDQRGQLLNTNADTIACEVSKAMSTAYDVDLVYCFEQPGVLSDFENKTVIPEIKPSLYRKLKSKGTINEGMIPKLDNAFDAINDGVSVVKICHFSAVDELESSDFSGTVLVK